MHTTVTVATMTAEAREQVAAEFADFDAADTPAESKTVRRQLFHYHDELLIQVVDSDAPAHDEHTGPDLAAYVSGYGDAAAPFRPVAQRYYHWLPGPVQPSMYSTLVVNRLSPARRPQVADLFAEFDTTDVPHRMGTRRRQLFAYEGVYFHLQDFETPDGGAVIAQAWKQADPRFIQICDDLDPLIEKYDAATWRKPADAVAHRFYHWEKA
ncbi:TcmI family type II polyketide cyclase [Nocardia sp. SYP-A9097]|uniref:TcmI family type II polyketide cyclase n=1 Tax=Nocardia sp. SYP-A9097 TaxID=2663237 RepID=UPI00129B27AB|nr:TcmI family type II polyketide cyclase [Nocardia sp. SYP-A9097]MRH90107.1 TcmI family type II polyketide cyclase [Nocardia sp. SYP-A9097]